MLEEQLQVARAAVAEGLTQLLGKWVAEGEIVRGLGSLAIAFREHGERDSAHLDIGFWFNVGTEPPFILWDCAVGFGKTNEEATRMAVDLWLQSTAVVMLEFLEQTGAFADHAHGDDGLGMWGWHSIHGPITGWGKGDGGDVLQRWVIEHPLLPQLALVLSGALRREMPNGVKCILAHINNKDIVEVRINGVEHEAATAVLLGLSWPRPEIAFMRCYVMLVHPLDNADAEQQ